MADCIEQSQENKEIEKQKVEGISASELKSAKEAVTDNGNEESKEDQANEAETTKSIVVPSQEVTDTEEGTPMNGDHTESASASDNKAAESDKNSQSNDTQQTEASNTHSNEAPPTSQHSDQKAEPGPKPGTPKQVRAETTNIVTANNEAEKAVPEKVEPEKTEAKISEPEKPVESEVQQSDSNIETGAKLEESSKPAETAKQVEKVTEDGRVDMTDGSPKETKHTTEENMDETKSTQPEREVASADEQVVTSTTEGVGAAADEPAEEIKTPAKRGRKAGKKSTPKPKPTPKPKTTPTKKEEPSEDTKVSGEGNDEEEAMDVDQTPVLGSVERVEIMTGKRERRKVERLSSNMLTPATPGEKKKTQIPEGTGVKLQDCPIIEQNIQKTKGDELKVFHRFLFGNPGKSPMEVKRNLKAFCGWTFVVDDAEYKRKITAASKLNLPVLKAWCNMLKLQVGGTKDSLIERVMEFLMKPTAEGKEIQTKEKKTTETGAKRKRGKAASKQDEDDEGEESEGDNPEDEESEEEQEQSEEEDKPPAKRRKTAVTKKTPAKKKPSKTPAKGRGRGRPKKGAAAPEPESEEEEESGPPTDEEIRKQIEKILKTADLELVTMKTVRQQIIDLYPEHDLTDKREYIKSTVKEVLGA